MDNMERKILFFDIDGTLITNDERRIFPESAKRAIALARERGHLAYVNSGRVYSNINDLIRDAGFDGYVCGCGTYIIEHDKELLHHRLSRELCREVAGVCRDMGLVAIFEHTEHTCYDRELEGTVEIEILDYFKNQGIKLIDDIDSPEFIYDKFAAWYDPKKSDVAAFRKYVEEKGFNYVQREGDFCEVVPKGYSKATGIQFLLDYHNISIENAYAFGDSNNDLEMMEYVPNSVAMGKSSNEILRVASYHTDDVMSDGIYNALRHFGVI